MKIYLSKKDAVWSYIGTFLSMGMSFLLLPFILHFLDDSSVGFYYVLVSLSGIVLMFDFGFSPSIARNMAYAWCGAKSLLKQGGDVGNHNEPNYELMKAIVFTCKRIYFFIAMVALVLCATVGSIYIFTITKNYENPYFYFAWAIYALAIVINLLVGYYSVFLLGIGAVEEINKANVYARFVQLTACVLFLAFGFGIVGVAFAYFLYGLVYRVIANKYFYYYRGLGKQLQQTIVSNPSYTCRNIFNTIWPNTWRDGLVTLSNYILNQSTIIIASLFLSLYETGLYSLSVQLMSAVGQIAVTLYSAYQPSLQSAYVNGQKDKQRDFLSAIVVSFVVMFFIGTVGLILFGLPIIRFIKPSYTVQISLLLAVGFYQFILKYRNIYCSFLSTTNRIIYFKSFLLSAILCVGLSVLMAGVFKTGVFGLVFAQILSQGAYNIWHWSMLVHKELDYSIFDTFNYGTKELLAFINTKRYKKNSY